MLANIQEKLGCTRLEKSASSLDWQNRQSLDCSWDCLESLVFQARMLVTPVSNSATSRLSVLAMEYREKRD